MEAEDKITKAKTRLILEQPFFATIALQLKFIPDSSIKTTTTNGIELKFNPSFIERLSPDELTTVLAHEVMHLTLLHHTRRNNRDKNKWNDAADYAINPLLIASGFALPAGCKYEKEYENKCAEQIYDLIPVPNRQDANNQADNASNSVTNGTSGANGSFEYDSIGEVEDPPEEVSVQEAEANIKELLAQASMIARRQGKLPGAIDRLIEEVLQPKIDWKESLSRFIAEIARNDYSWIKPSPRYLYSNTYLPSLESIEVGKIILIVDTSSSINHSILEQFGAEIQEITSFFQAPLQIIYVDAKVQSIQDVDSDEPLILKPKGGGGTNFIPGFNYIDQNDLQPKAVVYLTDGECSSFPGIPDYPVLWAQFGYAKFSPPFGDVIQV